MILVYCHVEKSVHCGKAAEGFENVRHLITVHELTVGEMRMNFFMILKNMRSSLQPHFPRPKERRKVMRKRLLAAGLMIVLAVSALAGCGGKKEVTAKSLLESVDKQSKDMKSMESKMVMNMTMESEDLTQLGGSMEITMDVDVQTTKDPAATYMEGTMGMMGMNFDVKNYTVQEGEELCSYTNVMDQWVLQKIKFDKEAFQSISTSSAELLDSVDSLTLQEDTKDVDGVEAYIITGAIGGDKMQELMQSATSSMGSVLGDAAAMDLSGVTVDVEYAVSKEDEKPLYTNMVFHGMESAIPQSGVSFSDFTVNMKYISFDTVESITVPQEAIDKAQDISSLTETGDDSLGVTESETAQ